MFQSFSSPQRHMDRKSATSILPGHTKEWTVPNWNNISVRLRRGGEFWRSWHAIWGTSRDERSRSHQRLCIHDCFGIRASEKLVQGGGSWCGGPWWHRAYVQRYWADTTGWLPNGDLQGVREGSGCFLLICVWRLSKQSCPSLPTVLQTQSNPQNPLKPTSFKA